MSLSKTEFYFDLSDDRIAKYPLGNRDESKLLFYNNNKVSHHGFKEVSQLLDDSYLLVMNNAKVIPARLYFKRATGAIIEVLLLEPVLPSSYEEVFNSTQRCQWKCIIGNLKKWKDDEEVELADHDNVVRARLIDRDIRIVELSWFKGVSFNSLLDRVGELPLPPYLNRDTELTDNDTYQTVFAKQVGSVAAPTAGLHFTEEVFSDINARGIKSEEVTLHVGAGTFLPVKAENVLDHEMHIEHFEVTKKAIQNLKKNSKRIAVGTTTLRVLESLYWIGCQLSEGRESLFVKKLDPYDANFSMSYNVALEHILDYMNEQGIEKLFAATEILILPYYKLRSIAGLITNFHLPESTLLMLIASVVGDKWKMLYQEAIENNYRFLSYGDSSLLMKH